VCMLNFCGADVKIPSTPRVEGLRPKWITWAGIYISGWWLIYKWSTNGNYQWDDPQSLRFQRIILVHLKISMNIWLVFLTIFKHMSESQWEGWHPIYEMETKTWVKPPTRYALFTSAFQKPFAQHGLSPILGLLLGDLGTWLGTLGPWDLGELGHCQHECSDFECTEGSHQ
jgi:hypothetical protein